MTTVIFPDVDTALMILPQFVGQSVSLRKPHRRLDEKFGRFSVPRKSRHQLPRSIQFLRAYVAEAGSLQSEPGIRNELTEGQSQCMPHAGRELLGSDFAATQKR